MPSRFDVNGGNSRPPEAQLPARPTAVRRAIYVTFGAEIFEIADFASFQPRLF
jgi:hypothetical protein